MRTLKLQLDYVLKRNIPQSDIRKSRAVWDVAFDSDHRPVLLSFKIRFHKRNRGVSLQPKIDMVGLKDDECRRKFRQRVSIHVGVRTRKKLSDADSFTKCIQDAARETLPVLLPRKKFAFASAETKSTYNSVCVARSAGDFNQEKRLRRKLRRQLQQDRDNEWTSRAMEFEKAWEDRNPRKAYALLKQYSGKMKRCSPVLNTANGVAVGEATLPIWKEHFKALLNRLAPSAPELEHVHRPTYAVNEEPPTVSEVLVCIQKMKNGKSGGDDGISAETLKYLPPSGIREMIKIIRSIWIDERIPDSWRHAIIIPLHKKLSLTDPRNYRGISLLRVMYKVLERIILDRLIKHREETTRDEQAGFRPGRSMIDQVLIVRRVIEIWQRYSKPMQLAFLDFEAAFDSPHRGRLLNALSADGVPGKFVRLLDDMNQRATAAVRTPAGCTTPFEVVTGVRQGAVAGPFLFNFAVDDIMRRTVNQCPADIVLAPSGCPLTDLEYADDVVIFAESSTKLQHVVNLVSKLAAAYGLSLRPDKCKQMWISSRPRTGIRVDGQPIELVDGFCYLGCTLKNNGSYERDVQQRCAKATSAFNSLTKCLWSTPITNEVKLRVYLSAIRPIMMHGSETWAAPSTVMERLDCTERKLLRRLLCYFWPRVCHNEDLYAEINVVYRRMTRGRYQHLAPPSKAAKVNRLRFFGHILRRPADRLVQRVLKSSPGSSWKKPPGRKRKFWTGKERW
ncbi:hypothetical protein RB195_010554 [Necator americanus]|uniref:Reverse transcriptase domain-containing protein n=1 Tax=Necator americanus TaxID=51031 RepID=A0ABR1CYJ7_NECAM